MGNHLIFKYPHILVYPCDVVFIFIPARVSLLPTSQFTQSHPLRILLFRLSGLAKLRDRFSDPYMQDVFSGLFPRDNARDTRFAINFFTSIGLGGLTDGLRGN